MVGGLGASPALAAPPSNDTYVTAKQVTALPYSDAVDASEATTDAVDAAVNAGSACGSLPAINGSVWYRVTVPAGVRGIIVDATTYDPAYSATFLFIRGDPAGVFTANICGDVGVRQVLSTTPGEQIYIWIAGYVPGQPTGHLSLTLTPLSGMPSATMTLSAPGAFDRATGSATVGGTLTCRSPAPWVSRMYVTVYQPKGAYGTTARTSFTPTCDRQQHPWKATLKPTSGTFAQGRSRVTLSFISTIDTDISRTVSTLSRRIRLVAAG